jgi:flavin-binding protein dodecin
MDHVYKTIQLTGSSKVGLAPAIETAIERASKSLEGLRWFEVDEIRGHIVDGHVEHWQVGVKVGFTLQDDA